MVLDENNFKECFTNNLTEGVILRNNGYDNNIPYLMCYKHLHLCEFMGLINGNYTHFFQV